MIQYRYIQITAYEVQKFPYSSKTELVESMPHLITAPTFSGWTLSLYISPSAL